MKSEYINKIIGLILANEASESEEVIFREWLEHSEENRYHFRLLKQEWEANRPRYKIVNSEEIKDIIWNEGVNSEKRHLHKSPRSLSFNLPFYFKVAAVLVVLISATMVFVQYSDDIQHDNKSEKVWVTKANPIGQKSKIFLPDGTEVWLNAGSDLRYIERFTDSARIVYLNGEAFFSVVKDIDRPFTVISNNVNTTALGTSFNVNAFKENVEVALISGKVQVVGIDAGSSEGQVVLEPGEMALYNDTNQVFAVSKYDIEQVAGWKDGILYFKDTPFSEVLRKLELWYGVRITLKGNTTITEHYTGKFTNENLRNVLESMSFALDFEYKLKDKNAEIYAN